MSPMEDLLSRQKTAFLRDMNPNFASRRDRLDRLEAMIVRHETDIAAAISRDFGNRSVHETQLLEFIPVLGALRHAR
ncbi:MAG: coniferyl aldehyde dehydrogenase, partial [Rhodoblastus sp.]